MTGLARACRRRVRDQRAARVRSAHLGGPGLLPPAIESRPVPLELLGALAAASARLALAFSEPPIPQAPVLQTPVEPRGGPRRRRRRPKARGGRARTVRALALTLGAAARRGRLVRRPGRAVDRSVLRRTAGQPTPSRSQLHPQPNTASARSSRTPSPRPPGSRSSSRCSPGSSCCSASTGPASSRNHKTNRAPAASLDRDRASHHVNRRPTVPTRRQPIPDPTKQQPVNDRRSNHTNPQGPVFRCLMAQTTPGYAITSTRGWDPGPL